jgi:hypothetical protein
MGCIRYRDHVGWLPFILWYKRYLQVGLQKELLPWYNTGNFDLLCLHPSLHISLQKDTELIPSSLPQHECICNTANFLPSVSYPTSFSIYGTWDQTTATVCSDILNASLSCMVSSRISNYVFCITHIEQVGRPRNYYISTFTTHQLNVPCWPPWSIYSMTMLHVPSGICFPSKSMAIIFYITHIEQQSFDHVMTYIAYSPTECPMLTPPVHLFRCLPCPIRYVLSKSYNYIFHTILNPTESFDHVMTYISLTYSPDVHVDPS